MSNNNEPKIYIRADEDVYHEYFFMDLDHAIVSNIEFIKQSVLYFFNENINIDSIDSILKKTKNIVTSIQKLYILTVTYKNFYNKIKNNNHNSDATDKFLNYLFSDIIILLEKINNFWERIIKINDLKTKINYLKYEKQFFEKNHIGQKNAREIVDSATNELSDYGVFKLITADGPPFNIIEPILKIVIIPIYYSLTLLKCIPSTTFGIFHTGYNAVNRNIIKFKISKKKNEIKKLETDNLDIATCISNIETNNEENIKNYFDKMNEDINKINFINPTLQNFKDRYNDFMNYIHDIYKIKPFKIKPFDKDNLDQDYLFSIIYVEYEKYHYYTDIISTTEEDLQKLKRELPKLTQKELVIMYKGIFSLPDSTKVTEIEYVLIDAIINETKVHEIIERELQKLTRKELVIMYKGIFSLPDSTKFTAIQNVLIDAIKDVLIDAIINETKVPEIIEEDLQKLTQKELVIMYKGIFSLPYSTKFTAIQNVLIDAIINKTKEELQKLTRNELVIMYKEIFSLPDSTKFTAIENVLIDAIKDVLIDAIINETKVPEIIESIKTYPRDSGGAKNKKRTTIKSGHTLLRKTKHTNRNKIYRNKIYRNTKRIRQTKKR